MLSRREHDEASRIAKVRTHVERATEKMKNNVIMLQENMSLSMMGIADQLMMVCAAICSD